MRYPTVALLILALASAPTRASGQDRADVPALFRELAFRSIGPAVTGGRIHDVEALAHDPSTIYVATATGGIWKTTNKGTTWRPVFDGQATSTFGDLAIAPGDPAVVWAGSGEQNNRQSTSWGSGVYRSVDSGESWTHLGLTETRHIGRILVHPSDPDVAWVAAQGNLWKPTPDRGVYRTEDGGATWQKVLFVDTLTGATDLALDACDPDVVYAATYQRLRRAWGFNGGGPGSGIWRSRDGGDSWERLTDGIPPGDKGRIGLAAASNRCGVANAIIEHAGASGVYRTEDGGASWERMSARNIRPMYYSHIFIDPTDADRVYTLATRSAVSEDGGRTWNDVSGRKVYDVGVHSDHHAMWIDHRRPEHYYLAGDAGLYETWDGGRTYVRLDNLPIAQLYALGVDTRDPYRVYVGLQDNHSWMGPSATRHWAGILGHDWRQIGFGDGMYHQSDPTDPRVLYSNAQNGEYTRVDTETGDRMDIAPRPPEGEDDYRFDWVSPSLLSAHDPDVLYVGGNRLFISRDRGETWARTVDLTRAVDRDTLTLMGIPGSEITLSRNDGTASYGEITTIAESPLDPAILWVGTDDGRLQLSRDGGDTWTDVADAVVGVPDDTYVSRVIASRSAPGTVYATFDAHRDGDFRTYVFRSTDFGVTWTPRIAGLDGAGSANVIREHPDDPAVLFLGTEHALWASTDTAASWQRIGANLPTTPYDDLVIHPRSGDLVVATHGRGVWILDDASSLARLDDAAGRPAHVFPVRDAAIHQYWKDTSYRGDGEWAGANPPAVIIDYRLTGAARDTRIEIQRDGETIRTLDARGEPGVIHRVTWDLRHPPFDPAEDDVVRGLARPVGPRGPFVSPGRYLVALTAGEDRATAELLVRGDPQLPMLTDADYRARESFMLAIRSVRETIRAASDGDTSAGSALPGLDRRARSLQDQLMGGDVQPGTLHPPTPGQLDRLRALEEDVEEAVRGTGGG